MRRYALLLSLFTAACGPAEPTRLTYDTSYPDAVAGDGPAPTGPTWCSLPGTTPDRAVVPDGFCIRRYAAVPEARVLVAAPSGELFVASPSNFTPGGARGGMGEISLLTDEDGDGVATRSTFAGGLSQVHGLALAPGWLYFTTPEGVWRTPFAAGQRAETTAMRSLVARFETIPNGRWTHGVAVSAGGQVLASQAVYSANTCPDNARIGAVLSVANGAMTEMAGGLRNPMYLRCHPTAELCMAAELGDDGGQSFNARERLLQLAPGQQYGFPCCTARGAGTPYRASYDCSTVTPEVSSFPLNDTPFGLDWERGAWPEPFRGALFVALHGSFYSVPQWAGARVVFARTDPSTRLPTGEWQPFVYGFGPGGGPLERPADVAFGPDGRLFLADDHGNAVYWIAPAELRRAR